jgi:sigma-54 dependent transcriptional regulator, acetoin dehydrogenase operon transcriptional activator AcoR
MLDQKNGKVERPVGDGQVSGASKVKTEGWQVKSLAKWALVPALAVLPVLSEIIDAYTRDVLSFSDPSDWSLVVFKMVLFGAIGVYFCRKSIERDRMFRALIDREKRYRELFENSIVSIMITAPDGKLLEANAAFFHIFGYSKDELQNFNMLQLYASPADRARFREAVERDGSVKDVEVIRRKKDGTEIVCEMSATLQKDDGGRILGYQTILRDVTKSKQAELALRTLHSELERKVDERTKELLEANESLRQEIADRQRVEAELRRTEERFRAVFESAQDCIFIKSRELRYTHVNPAMLRLFAIPSERIIGATDEAVFDADTSSRLRDIEQRVLTGHTLEIEQTIRGGADQVILSCIRAPLRDSCGNIVGIYGIARDLTDRKAKEAELEASPGGYVTSSMRAVLEQVALASKTDSIVLLLGESGAGKDHLARYLHDMSKRSDGPFFAINCAALTAELAESELFGHEAGSFTGSRGRKRGLLELAEGGTLLLNEIGDLPLPLQAKLLSFLDTQSFTRVGGEKTVRVNTRLIAATNRDLEREVARGAFRDDLFYRLNVFTIRVPPLRKRPEDLEQLVAQMLETLSKKMGFSEVPAVGEAVMRELAQYHWPGNVRELRNVLERALILCDRKKIALRDIGELQTDLLASDGAKAGLSFVVSVNKWNPLPKVLRETERSLCAEALLRSNGSIKNAALSLGISRDKMKYLMKSLGVQRNSAPQRLDMGITFTHA